MPSCRAVVLKNREGKGFPEEERQPDQKGVSLESEASEKSRVHFQQINRHDSEQNILMQSLVEALPEQALNFKCCVLPVLKITLCKRICDT